MAKFPLFYFYSLFNLCLITLKENGPSHSRMCQFKVRKCLSYSPFPSFAYTSPIYNQPSSHGYKKSILNPYQPFWISQPNHWLNGYTMSDWKRPLSTDSRLLCPSFRPFYGSKFTECLSLLSALVVFTVIPFIPLFLGFLARIPFITKA